MLLLRHFVTFVIFCYFCDMLLLLLHDISLLLRNVVTFLTFCYSFDILCRTLKFSPKLVGTLWKYFSSNCNITNSRYLLPFRSLMKLISFQFWRDEMRKKLWTLVYILARQCRPPYNLTIFVQKINQNSNFVRFCDFHKTFKIFFRSNI